MHTYPSEMYKIKNPIFYNFRGSIIPNTYEPKLDFCNFSPNYSKLAQKMFGRCLEKFYDEK